MGASSLRTQADHPCTRSHRSSSSLSLSALSLFQIPRLVAIDAKTNLSCAPPLVSTVFEPAEVSSFDFSDFEAQLAGHSGGGSSQFDDAPLSFAPQASSSRSLGSGSALDGATWSGSVRSYLPDARAEEAEAAEEEESASRVAAIEAAIRARQMAVSHGDTSCWGAQQTLRMHPRSLQLLSPVGLDMQSGGIAGAPTGGLDASRRVSSSGEALYTEDTAARDAAEDAFRAALERCDALRGVQLSCDVDGAFGGWGALYLRYIRDECPGAAILCIPVETPTASQQRSLNVSLTAALLAETADVVLPFSAAALWNSATRAEADDDMATRRLWDCRLRACLQQTADANGGRGRVALAEGAAAETLAAALDTIASPWRRPPIGTMGSVLNALKARPRANLVAAEIAMPNFGETDAGAEAARVAREHEASASGRRRAGLGALSNRQVDPRLAPPSRAGQSSLSGAIARTAARAGSDRPLSRMLINLSLSALDMGDVVETPSHDAMATAWAEAMASMRSDAGGREAERRAYSDSKLWTQNIVLRGGGTTRIARGDGHLLETYFQARHTASASGAESNIATRVEERGFCGWTPRPPAGAARRSYCDTFLSSIAHSAVVEGDTAPVKSAAVMTRLSQGSELGRCVVCVCVCVCVCVSSSESRFCLTPLLSHTPQGRRDVERVIESKEAKAVDPPQQVRHE